MTKIMIVDENTCVNTQCESPHLWNIDKYLNELSWHEKLATVVCSSCANKLRDGLDSSDAWKWKDYYLLADNYIKLKREGKL